MSRMYDRSAANRTLPRRGTRPTGAVRTAVGPEADGALAPDNRMADPPVAGGGDTLGIPGLIGRRARWVGARMRHR